MRAKTVPVKAYIFDFDDTLVKTDVKVHIIVNGKRIKSLTPTEFNNYHLGQGETYDVSDFIDPRFILNAQKFKMWPALQSISNAKKMGRGTSDIYILTARNEKAKMPIHTFLERNGIDIPIENIITVGRNNPEGQDIAKDKEMVLRELKKKYADITFFDDSEENIDLASKVGGIRTRLVDWNK